VRQVSVVLETTVTDHLRVAFEARYEPRVSLVPKRVM
jgi:hypothetical protein